MENPLPLNQIRFLLDESQIYANEMLRHQLRDANPMDVAAAFSELDLQDRLRILRALDAGTAAQVMDETDAASRAEVLEILDPDAITELVEALPPDEGADLLQQLPEEVEQQVLDDIPEDHAAELRELTDYPPDTAGGMMTTDYVRVPVSDTAEGALARVRREEDAEHVGEVYVVDDGGRLRGIVALPELLEQPEHAPVERFMERDFHSVTLDTDQQDVANRVQKYNLPSLAVVDEGGVMKGLITLDDVMDVMEEEADEDLFLIAGSLSRGLAAEPVRRKYLKRLPFLLTTFLGGGMTILIQYFFRLTTDQLIAVTFFIPIINGLSGNVGLQSSTIVVRALATGEIALGRILRLLPREVATGLLIGLTFGAACGGLTALVSDSLHASPLLGLVVGLSLVSGTTVAAFLGTAVPALCERVGIDPAVSAGPFIATLLDSTALVIYLGIATATIHLLLTPP